MDFSLTMGIKPEISQLLYKEQAAHIYGKAFGVTVYSKLIDADLVDGEYMIQMTPEDVSTLLERLIEIRDERDDLTPEVKAALDDAIIWLNIFEVSYC